MSGNQDFVIKKGVLQGYKGPGGDVTIPEGVTEIGYGAFRYCASLTSVTIPESVTVIGGYAFSGCANLTSVTIPEGVTVIGSIFENCTGLTSVTIPESVTVIGWEAFQGCTGLTSVTIPEGVTVIGKWAFRGCTGLTSVTIPAGVTEIGEWAFCDCTGLTSVTIPEGVTVIGACAFWGCTGLTSVTIPAGVTEIGKDAFAGCKSLTSVTIPEGVKIIGKHAFSGCKKLEPPRELLRGEKKLPASLTETIQELWTRKLQPKDWAGLYLFQEAKAWTELLRKHMPDGQAEEIVQAMAELLAGSKKAKYFARAAEYAQKHQDSVKPEVLQFFIDGAKPAKAAETAKAEKARKTAETAQKAAEKEAEAFGNTPIAGLWKLYRESDLMASYRKKGGKESPLKKVLLNPSLKLDKPQKTAPPFVVLCAVVPYMDQYSYHQAISGYKHGAYSNYQTIEAADKAAAALDPASFQEFLSKNLPVSVYGGPHASWMLPYCRYADGKRIISLNSQMQNWADWYGYGPTGRSKIITARGAMLLSDTREAMLYLDKVKTRSGTVLDGYAKLRGTKAETLRDTVLADFGLDEKGEKVYDLGSNTVTVTLAQDLTLSIFDGNAGKAVTSIPKKGADEAKHAAAKADFAEMKKNVKKVVKARCDRLFQDFLSGAEYPAGKWQATYLGENPVLRQVASLLVWSQDGQTFTLRDGAVIDSGEQPYAISGRPIQVAHPMEMKPGDVLAWQKYFNNHGIKQPFAQVWEPVVHESAIRPNMYQNAELPLYRFKGKEKHGISFSYDYSLCALNISFTDCDLELDCSALDMYHNNLDLNGLVKMGKFTFKKYTRQVNHIVALLDQWTIIGRIMRDDASIVTHLDSATLAQVMEYLNLAIDNGRANVTAELLNYKNEHFPDFDPLAEFTLDDL